MLLTMDAGKEITVAVAISAIKTANAELKRIAKLKDYYDGKHAILERKKPKTLSDVRVVTNHAKFIADIATGYLLGNPVDYQPKLKGVDITPVTDEYEEQDMASIDYDLALDCSACGLAYEFLYNEDNSVRSVRVEPTQAICIYDDTVLHKKIAGIVFKPSVTNKTGFEYIQIITAKEIRNYKDNGKDLMIADGKPIPHYFNYVPLIQHRNNPRMVGDFEPVVPLIDGYNTLQSDRINDKIQLVEALLIGYGFTLTDEQNATMKAYRTLTGLPIGAKAEYLVKQLNETDVDVLRRVIGEDIHKISMVPNLTDKEFAGNSSGVALRFKLLAFEQLTQNKERAFVSGLRERFTLYSTYLKNAGLMAKVVKGTEVKAVFKRNLPQNDYETSQMLTNLDGYVSKVTGVSQLSFVPDAEAEVAKAEKEKQEAMERVVSQYGTLPNDDKTDKSKGTTMPPAKMPNATMPNSTAGSGAK